ncbi:MAG: glycosyltransferase family 2 protein [Gemmatimonadetes bacterium]|nr:glycosyltransferase family 2 protein [Gemmatimonadota bacterium]
MIPPLPGLPIAAGHRDPDGRAEERPHIVSVVIPARNEAPRIERVVRAVLAQRRAGLELDLVVVDDGSTDGTSEVAHAAGARVLRPDAQAPRGPRGGNPGAARNRGAEAARGDPIVFLDADCEPGEGWLDSLLRAHETAAVVGGSLDLPDGLPLTARCGYYCDWYHTHPGRPAGRVPNHPPANLSVRRQVLRDAGGFAEDMPVADGHEELGWQTAARAAGHTIRFEPRALACHHNPPGIANLLRRSYRWGYSSLEGKVQTGGARWGGLYRRPWLLIALSGPFAVAQAVYIVACWVRVGRLEPLLLAPGIFASRLAWATGMTVGGLRWLVRSRGPGALPEHARGFAPRSSPP